MRVLVTGSMGFVGQALTAHLIHRGHTVLGLDAAATVELPETSIVFPSKLENTHFRWDTDRIRCAVASDPLF